MFIRSLTLASLLAVASPLLAADSDAPLAKDRGQYRPLIILAPNAGDPTLVNLKKALEEPANREAFNQRNMVLYTVVNMVGQRNGKEMDTQSTMALIRELNLGAGSKIKVVLVGKDGEKKVEKTELNDPKELFSTIDQMPMAEKEAAARAPAQAEAPAPAASAGKGQKAGKPGKEPQALDD